jgi:hypothetical protein
MDHQCGKKGKTFSDPFSALKLTSLFLLDLSMLKKNCKKFLFSQYHGTIYDTGIQSLFNLLVLPVSWSLRARPLLILVLSAQFPLSNVWLNQR